MKRTHSAVLSAE